MTVLLDSESRMLHLNISQKKEAEIIFCHTFFQQHEKSLAARNISTPWRLYDCYTFIDKIVFSLTFFHRLVSHSQSIFYYYDILNDRETPVCFDIMPSSQTHKRLQIALFKLDSLTCFIFSNGFLFCSFLFFMFSSIFS